MHDEGQGAPQSYMGALRWFRKAVDQGHAGAQSKLGVRYVKGQGVFQSYTGALRW